MQKGGFLGEGGDQKQRQEPLGGQIRKHDDMYVVCMKMLCENLLLWYFKFLIKQRMQSVIQENAKQTNH